MGFSVMLSLRCLPNTGALTVLALFLLSSEHYAVCCTFLFPCPYSGLFSSHTHTHTHEYQTRGVDLHNENEKRTRHHMYVNSYNITALGLRERAFDCWDADFNWQDVSIEQWSVWEASVAVRALCMLWISFDIKLIIRNSLIIDIVIDYSEKTVMIKLISRETIITIHAKTGF